MQNPNLKVDKFVAMKNGPLLCRFSDGSTLVLCRCGRSQGKPFCDGSHQGFRPGGWDLDENDEEVNLPEWAGRVFEAEEFLMIGRQST